MACDHGDVSVVVGPEVDKYGFVQQYIVGHSVRQKKHRDVSGYFIIDTAKNQRWVGLSEKTWREQLLRLGIEAPTLLDTAYNPDYNKG